MKVNTLELTGHALDWAVSKCQRLKGDVISAVIVGEFSPSTDWSLGGPIIEREWIEIVPWPNESEENLRWQAVHIDTGCKAYGSTPLIAAMQCYVASKLGDTIEVPEELQ